MNKFFTNAGRSLAAAFLAVLAMALCRADVSHTSNNVSEAFGPLTLSIVAEQKTWRLEKPFPVHVRIENRLNMPISIETYSLNVYFEMLSLDFKLMQLTGKERVPIALIRPVGPNLGPIASKPKRLLPHEHWDTTVDFNDWKPAAQQKLPIGTYELEAYWTAGFSDQAGNHLAAGAGSNVLAIELQD